MYRDPRERERGAARSDVTSLWIDFVLLPGKLEEHLAAGPSAIPTPPDLISMLLEQALVNHKTGSAANSSANNAIKDAELQGFPKAPPFVALLCEKAARVAVLMSATLNDIESSIPSQLHQFILLKALIQHDKPRSLLHRCNLHRWVIHRALESHPVGSASPNVVLPTNRLGMWVADNDLGDVFYGLLNGNEDPTPLSSVSDSRFEEERASVEFLERVLREEQPDLNLKDPTKAHKETVFEKSNANGSSSLQQTLGMAFRCQIILDVAEAYFMRGRIRKAHDLFSECGVMLRLLTVTESTREVEEQRGPVLAPDASRSCGRMAVLSPVPQDRLAGFLIACKMLLGTLEDGNILESKRSSPRDDGSAVACCYAGAPSPSQWAVINCEQNRMAARKYSNVVNSQSPLANGNSSDSDFSSGKENAGTIVTDRTTDGKDKVGRAVEENNVLDRKSGSRKRIRVEDANGEVTQLGPQIEVVDEKRRDSEMNDSEPILAYGDKARFEEKSSSPMVSCATADGLSNGGDGTAHGSTEMEGENGNYAWKDKSTIVPFPSNVKVIDAMKPFYSGACCAPEAEMFKGLQVDPTDLSSGADSDSEGLPSTKHERSLISAFVEDTLRGHLSWSYCLAVERDPLLSKPVRSKLAACNVVRSVLEGAPVESFLRASGHFVDNEDAVVFLMKLLLSIKRLQGSDRLLELTAICKVDSKQNRRLAKLGFLKQNPEGKLLADAADVACRVEDLAMYVCCVIDKPWCWRYAAKVELVGQSDIPTFSRSLPRKVLRKVEGSGVFPKTSSSLSEIPPSLDIARLSESEFSPVSDILLRFVQADSIRELEALVRKFVTIPGRANAEDMKRPKIPNKNCEHVKTPVTSDLVKLAGNHSGDTPNSWHESDKHFRCSKCESPSINISSDKIHSSSLDVHVAAVLRRRAFNALEIMGDAVAAKRLYELVLTFQPRDSDSAMMLWLLDNTDSDGKVLSQGMRDIASRKEGTMPPSVGLLDVAILRLIEKEFWSSLCELCKWVVPLVFPERNGRDGPLPGDVGEDENVSSDFGGTSERAGMKKASGWKSRRRRLLQTLNITKTIVDLMPLCVSIQTAVSRNCNEDLSRLGSSLSQLFEEFLCNLVGVEPDEQVAGGVDDALRLRNSQAGLGSFLLPSAGVPLIPQVSSPRVLMALASLTAGWLQRCNTLGLAPWPLSVERYGVLAGVTAGASLPSAVGSLPYVASVLRPVRVSPEFGRHLFGVLLEGIVRIPGIIETDREKGHRWLQGLADLAYEDESYVKALRLYLQAGAVRSAQYCDKALSMNRDIFTPWVIQRMVAACRAIGATVQAAVLCQCLPVPDHEKAFQILQENTLIMDRDAAAYFECLWEVPILELLVHLHSRAGDEARVATLIGLLQRPALNVHNPPAIRQAHINAMEQRFLQRLAGELL